jgi:hypothetical protein
MFFMSASQGRISELEKRLSSFGTTSGQKGSRRGAADKKAAAPRPPSPATDEEDISTDDTQPGGSAEPNANEDEERLKQRIQELEAKVRKYHLKRWNCPKYFGVCEAVLYSILYNLGLHKERPKEAIQHFKIRTLKKNFYFYGSFLPSWIRIRIRIRIRFGLPGSLIQRYRSGSFHHQAKTFRKNLIFTIL